MMERYTSQERFEIIKINNRPSRSTIERLVEKFASTGTGEDFPVPVRQRSSRSVDKIAAAEASTEESPNVSLTRRSQALDISVTLLWRLLRIILAYIFTKLNSRKN